MANVSEELARLAQLRDQGVLTSEEFEQQKAAVLRGDHPASPAAETPAPGKKSMGKGCVIAIVAIVVILIIIGLIGGNSANNVVQPPTTGAATEVTGAAAEGPAAPALTMDGYNRIKTGMTFEQVTAIIGQPSQEMSRNELAGTETVMYMWEGMLGANMNAMFQNGKLVQKAQFGLR